MADKGMTLAIVLLVAGMIVGGGIGYFAAPPQIPSSSIIDIYPVHPIYSTTLPNDLSTAQVYRISGDYLMYVWSVNLMNGYQQVYFTYLKIGG